MKITLPPLPEGADRWNVYGVIPQYQDEPEARRWQERLIYLVLMWAHDRAESFWHWCYRKSRPYAPPLPFRIEDKHILIETVTDRG